MPDNIKAYICENNHTSSAFGRFPGGERHCLDCGAKVWRVEEFLAVAKIPSPSPASDQLREAVLNQFQKLPDETGAMFYFNSDWYASKWGCDTLDHIIDAVSALTRPPQEDDDEE